MRLKGGRCNITTNALELSQKVNKPRYLDRKNHFVYFFAQPTEAGPGLHNSLPPQNHAGVSMVHQVTLKDGIVIGFMLGLWLYSIVLMFRFDPADPASFPNYTAMIDYISGLGVKCSTFPMINKGVQKRPPFFGSG